MNGHTLFVYDFRNHIASIRPRTFHLGEEADCLRRQQFRAEERLGELAHALKKIWRRKNRRQGFQKPIPAYCGQGTAECGRTVSSGKLNAPSMALEVVPISNHCSRGM